MQSTLLNSIPNLKDVYPYASFQPPPFYYQPTGEMQIYQFQLFEATSVMNGSQSAMYQFNANAPWQLVYLPYVKSVPQLPPHQTLSAPPNYPVNIETFGLSACSSQAQLSGPNVYKTFTVTLSSGPIAECRHVSFIGTVPPQAPYVPHSCVNQSLQANAPQGFRLHLSDGTQVCYNWLQVVTSCNSGPCPNGYAAGPVDLFLQFGAS